MKVTLWVVGPDHGAIIVNHKERLPLARYPNHEQRPVRAACCNWYREIHDSDSLSPGEELHRSWL
jgi:hypothetical protein